MIVYVNRGIRRMSVLPVAILTPLCVVLPVKTRALQALVVVVATIPPIPPLPQTAPVLQQGGHRVLLPMDLVVLVYVDS